jgi:hypothetical protein
MEPPKPPSSVPHKPKLLDQAWEIVRANYYSRRTEEVYLAWMPRFILFHHKRHPKEMGLRGLAACGCRWEQTVSLFYLPGL